MKGRRLGPKCYIFFIYSRTILFFRLQLEIEPEYHRMIIGAKGRVITKIREDFGVSVSLPSRGAEDEHIITITGYEEKALAARDHILGILDEYVSFLFLVFNPCTCTCVLYNGVFHWFECIK